MSRKKGINPRDSLHERDVVAAADAIVRESPLNRDDQISALAPVQEEELHPPLPRRQGYTVEEWMALQPNACFYMVPNSFQDLLAPTLPEPVMRIIRYIWRESFGKRNLKTGGSRRTVDERMERFATQEADRARTRFRREQKLANGYTWQKAAQLQQDLAEWEEEWFDWEERSVKPGAPRKPRETWTITEEQEEEIERQVADFMQSPDIEKVLKKRRQEMFDNADEREFNYVSVSIRRMSDSMKLHPDTMRKALAWAVKHELLTKRSGGYTSKGRAADEYALGDEVWYVLETGNYREEFREKFGIDTRRSSAFWTMTYDATSKGYRKRDRFIKKNYFDDSYGPNFSAPNVMEDVLGPNLPSPVMHLLWHVVRETIGRTVEGLWFGNRDDFTETNTEDIGYTRLSVSGAARLFGPASVNSRTPAQKEAQKRAASQRVRTGRYKTLTTNNRPYMRDRTAVREAIEWGVDHGIFTKTRDWYTIGPEVLHVFQSGDFSPELHKKLDVKTRPGKPCYDEDRLAALNDEGSNGVVIG